MPIFIPNKRRDTCDTSAGFTLIELLIVLFLIGLAATAVVLTSRSISANTVREADRFAARIAAVRDRAITEGRHFAIWVRPSGYGFEQRDNRQWIAMTDPRFQTIRWKSPFRATVDQNSAIRLSFDENGLPSSPATIEITDGNQRAQVTITAAGRIDVAR